MKFCPSCGKQNEDASKFCKSCGYKLYVEEATVSVEPKVKKVMKKSKATLIIAIAIVAALAVFAGIFFFTNLLGNHIMNLTERINYYDDELQTKEEREFNSNGDIVKIARCSYYYGTKDVEYETVTVFEYDSKHMLSGYTEESTFYDEDGMITSNYVEVCTVKSYKKDGLIYNDIYDEDDNFICTNVYDKHGQHIKGLDEDGEVFYEAEYKYDFFGKIASMAEKFYIENAVDYWYEFEFEYDGDEVRYKITDASDWDECEEVYDSREFVCKWNFYYFW